MWILFGTNHDTVEHEPYVYFIGIFDSIDLANCHKNHLISLRRPTMHSDYFVKEVKVNNLYTNGWSNGWDDAGSATEGRNLVQPSVVPRNVVEASEYEESTNEHEKWRQKRREEWSNYKDDFATSYLQHTFQEITGISGDISTNNDNLPLPLQLWIDRMVDKLQGQYYLLETTIPSTAKYTTVLHKIGFKQEFLDKHTDIDDDIGSHFSLESMLELMIDRVLYSII